MTPTIRVIPTAWTDLAEALKFMFLPLESPQRVIDIRKVRNVYLGCLHFDWTKHCSLTKPVLSIDSSSILDE
jgi:hypothetical protein